MNSTDDQDRRHPDDQQCRRRSRPRTRLRMPRAPRLAARRALGVVIALGMFWLLFWAVRFSGFAEPVLALVQPHLDQLGSLIDDPLGIDWGAQLIGWATLLIPNIGILLFLFDAHR